jgi:hypothetical protein
MGMMAFSWFDGGLGKPNQIDPMVSMSLNGQTGRATSMGGKKSLLKI